MGIGDLSSDDVEEQQPNDPSVSYLYIYENGREEISNWDADAQQAMATAYNVVSDGGIVRTTFKRSGQYENIHHATAELMVGISEVFESGDFQRLLDFVGPDADAVRQYLEDNEEIGQELLEGVKEAEAPSAD